MRKRSSKLSHDSIMEHWSWSLRNDFYYSRQLVNLLNTTEPSLWKLRGQVKFARCKFSPGSQLLNSTPIEVEDALTVSYNEG